MLRCSYVCNGTGFGGVSDEHLTINFINCRCGYTGDLRGILRNIYEAKLIFFAAVHHATIKIYSNLGLCLTWEIKIVKLQYLTI